jgi:hypothetical protein
MAEASRSGFGSRGGDSNEEMVAKLIVDTLQAQKFNGILLEGVASLIGVLSKAVTQGMIARQAKQLEEARRAAKNKVVEH